MSRLVRINKRSPDKFLDGRIRIQALVSYLGGEFIQAFASSVTA